MNFRQWRSAGVFAATSLLGMACQGTPEGPAAASHDAGPPCPTDTAGIQKAILVPRCGLSSCHVADDPAQGLDLVSPGLEERVVGVVGACERSIVTAGKPNESYLITKVTRRTPSCGAGMPFDGTVLSSWDIGCLTRWVENVAVPPPLSSDAASPPRPEDDASPGAGGASRDGGGALGSPSGAGGATAPTCATGKMRCGSTCITEILPTFDAIYTGILNKSCVFDSCHGGITPKEHLSMVTVDDAYESLVPVASSQVPTLKRVDPSYPDASYMVDKLRNRYLGKVTTTGDPSERMPLPPSKPLCEAKIAVIEEWIRQGAQR